ncbi:hypothetical protein [Ruegeria lacuscaerulensis]|uniref:hypothetical protein n=1 Tax=Ruegeria lacuscaerulensis TaxID=55218 RepID=UPI00147FD7C3|nr:hypothetical protein [Ruegeria lacuscaerulensis]
MELFKSILARLRGDPRVIDYGTNKVFRAAHLRPSSGYELKLGMRLLGLIGAIWILIDHYAPEATQDPQANFFIELFEYGVVALINAGDQLVAVVQARSFDVPLENLRGWFIAFVFLIAVWVFQDSFLFRLYCWLTDRESVWITVRPETLTARRRVLSFGKTIERSAIREVRIIANHPTGHDVVILHDGGCLRLASIFGDETRALVFKMRLDDLLTQTEPLKTLDTPPPKPVTAAEQPHLVH